MHTKELKSSHNPGASSAVAKNVNKLIPLPSSSHEGNRDQGPRNLPENRLRWAGGQAASRRLPPAGIGLARRKKEAGVGKRGPTLARRCGGEKLFVSLPRSPSPAFLRPSPTGRPVNCFLPNRT
ncbi:hypothetical protein E2320_022025 [Naja naja]|nr:hypothetical protein E2320_022025 [Naja naja]